MRSKIPVCLLATVSCGSGFAATGISGGHGGVFTTTGVVHRGEEFGSQVYFSGQNLGTIRVSDGLGSEGGGNGLKTKPTLIPEPTIAFLGIIGMALLLLRRK